MAAVYLGSGWFFARVRDGGLQIRVLSTDVFEPHQAGTVVTQVFVGPDDFVELLAQLVDRTTEETRTFLKLPASR